MNSISTNMPSMSSPASPTSAHAAASTPTTTGAAPLADRSLSPSPGPSFSPLSTHRQTPRKAATTTASARLASRNHTHYLRLASVWVVERYILVSPIPWGIPIAAAAISASPQHPPTSPQSQSEPTHQAKQSDSTRERAERPVQSAMATDPDTDPVAARPRSAAQHQVQERDQQQQLKGKWKKIWLRGLSVRIRPRKDTLRRAATTAAAPGTETGTGRLGGHGPAALERSTQTTTGQQTLRQSETPAHPAESDPSTAATTASHSAATSTTARTTTVPSSSSSSSSTSLSVSVGASVGNFPSSSGPCPTCGQRRHLDLHRPPTPVKPEDRFQFRSGVPYGPWTVTHPPPLAVSPAQETSDVPTPKIESAEESESGPLTAFHPYSRLPPELRSKILRFYLERPRIVEIRCMNDLKKIHFARNALGNLASNIAWSADNTLPALMWVNRECRSETRAFYRVQLPMHPTNKIAWPVIINPDFDTVIFTFPWSSEIPLDIFLSDCLAFDPLGVGIRHFGTRDRGGPETWDLTPVPGCAPLSKSLANLESYTEAIQLMDDRAAARFPVWMIHEGYLTSGIPAKDAFYQDVPRLLLSNDYEPPDAANQRNALEALRSQLGDYLPRNVAQGLVMQRMFYRKYFRHLRMKCTKTDLAGLGMVRQTPGGQTEEFFLSNGREVAGPRKKRRSALDVRPSSSWHLWDDD